MVGGRWIGRTDALAPNLALSYVADRADYVHSAGRHRLLRVDHSRNPVTTGRA